jgi:hypothetical protein
MADTIEGGAFKNADGEWIDANGKLLEGDKLSEAKAAAAKQTAADKAAFAAENERRKAAGQPPLPEPAKAPEARSVALSSSSTTAKER